MLISKALRMGRGDVVALTGGGGKTTIMFRLAAELVADGRAVVTTMTTKIFIGQMQSAPAHLIVEDEAALLAKLRPLLAQHHHVLLAGRALPEEGKVQGVSPDLIARIAAQPFVDAVLVEADGSRRLPFKAPAAHEPVVPPLATILVPVVGLDAIGAPLDAGHVHRPELVAALWGAAPGTLVSPELVAHVLVHPQGGAKGLPAGARFVPFLNKADAPGGTDAGRAIARRLLASRAVDAVLIGAAGSADPVREVWGRVGAVVLAAGTAKRFGALKQVQPWRGTSLVAHVAAQALRCPDIAEVVVTVGAEADAVEAAARQAGDIAAVHVPDWADGQSRSVQRGLAGLGGRCSAVIFLLADQPGVTPQLLTALIRRHRETLAPIVAPRHGGERGNPVLFDAATFGEFAALAGDIGARPVIQAHRDDIAWVDWPTDEILRDIDTPADYDAAL